MFALFFIIFGAICTIPIVATVELFKKGDRQFGYIGAFISIVLIFVSFLIFGQMREQEEFGSKCHSANGIVVRGQCIDSDAVIPIQR